MLILSIWEKERKRERKKGKKERENKRGKNKFYNVFKYYG